MILTGILTPDQALEAIEFETIFLLMAMMILVNIAAKSNIFVWLNTKIAYVTRGNPLALFLLFSSVTAVFSAFLDNVTTVILIIPLTIQLLQGMGKDPKPFVIAEIIFSNIGGGMTLIGDPPNIIIGGAANLKFMDFIQNLYIPIFFSALFTFIVFIILYWEKIKPLTKDLVELHIAFILIEKIRREFVKTTLHTDFIVKVLLILFATVVSFIMEEHTGIPTYISALSGAVLLGITTSKRMNIHEAFESVEWSTLFFFSGLFIMVKGVEMTGLLEVLSHWVANYSTDLFILSILILWVSGFVSMILDNIPFVTIMIPVIMGIQEKIDLSSDPHLLWWALSLGACLGGNATLIGASANVVAADISKKNNVHISFLEYMKISFPITIGILTICTIYLYFRTNSLI